MLFDGIQPSPDTTELAKELEAYETPPAALHDLAAARPDLLDRRQVWEPCAGTGVLAEALRARGHEVTASDIQDWGYGRIGFYADLFSLRRAPCELVVTNPPFSVAHRVVDHLLAVGARRVITLHSWTWYIAGGDAGAWWQSAPVTDVLPLQRRISLWRVDVPLAERKPRDPMRYAWYVFEPCARQAPRLQRLLKAQEGAGA